MNIRRMENRGGVDSPSQNQGTYPQATLRTRRGLLISVSEIARLTDFLRNLKALRVRSGADPVNKLWTRNRCRVGEVR